MLYATNCPTGQTFHVAGRDPRYEFRGLRRGPDHLPRRLSPKAYDECHTLLDPYETKLQPLDRFGWDRPAQRANDAQEHALNRKRIVRKHHGRIPKSPLGFRHSGWATSREKIARALRDAGTSLASQRRFAECGSKGIVCRDKNDPDSYVVVANYCRHRWCVPCGNARSAQLARVWQKYFENRSCRFITLTLKSDDSSLSDKLDRLYACYRRLQRGRLWKRCVEGSVAFLEVKLAKNSGAWHPHFHVIASGKYIPRQVLSDAWHEITGDSHIVDIRAVKDQREVGKYVTKYATKPGFATYIDRPRLMAEAIAALHGRRMMIRQGDYRGFAMKEDSDVRDLEPIISLRALLVKVAEGSPWATAVLARVMRVHSRPEKAEEFP
jgi:hypothetical protein